MRISRALAGVALLVAAGCKKEPPPPRVGVQQVAVAPSLEQAVPMTLDALSEVAVHEFARLTPGMTVAQWMEQASGDTLVTFQYNLPDDDPAPFCARATANFIAGTGQQVRRDAFFDVPAPDVNYNLPIGSDGAKLVREKCVLTGMRLITGAVSDSVWRVGMPALKESFARAFPQKVEESADKSNTLGVRPDGRWVRDSLRIILRRDRWRDDAEEEIGVVEATLPTSLLARVAARPMSDGGAARERAVRSAAALLAITPDSIEALVTMSRGNDHDGAGGARVAYIRRLLDASRAWPADRRAEAAVLADQFVSARLEGEEGTALAPYGGLGLEFTAQKDGARTLWNYQHTLLRGAIELAPDSRAAIVARVKQFEDYLRETMRCTDARHSYDEAVPMGRELLRASLDARTRALVQWMTAESLAGAVEADASRRPASADSVPHRSPYAAGARREAMPLFRSAFASGLGEAQNLDAWETAWRFAAGLPPVGLVRACLPE